MLHHRKSAKNVLYFQSINNTMDIILLNKVHAVYPFHTHAEHYTMGIVVDGEIIIETLCGTVLGIIEDDVILL